MLLTPYASKHTLTATLITHLPALLLFLFGKMLQTRAVLINIAERGAIFSAMHLSQGLLHSRRGDGALEDTVTQMTELE